METNYEKKKESAERERASAEDGAKIVKKYFQPNEFRMQNKLLLPCVSLSHTVTIPSVDVILLLLYCVYEGGAQTKRTAFALASEKLKIILSLQM